MGKTLHSHVTYTHKSTLMKKKILFPFPHPILQWKKRENVTFCAQLLRWNFEEPHRCASCQTHSCGCSSRKAVFMENCRSSVAGTETVNHTGPGHRGKKNLFSLSIQAISNEVKEQINNREKFFSYPSDKWKRVHGGGGPVVLAAETQPCQVEDEKRDW